jgi:hypothetical protein
MALLKNVKLHWARLGTPEKKYMSEETQWSVNAQVDDATSRKFVKGKLITKERWMEVDGEEVPVISFRRDTHYRKTGDDRTPVRVVDVYGQEVNASTIGNGTVANIQYSIRDWEYQGRKGKAMELLAVQIIDLVEYSGGSKAGDEFEFAARKEVSLEPIVSTADVDLSDDEFE